MKIAVQFNDVLGNTIQIKTAIDTFRQIENKSCWIVEGRKIFPKTTNWDIFYPLKNQYFETDEEAQDKIREHLSEYVEKSRKIGEKVCFQDIVL